MHFDEYQEWTQTTAIYPAEQAMNYLVPALAGECGEVASIHAKSIRDRFGKLSYEDRAKLAHELGDVLWIVAQLADEIGFELEAIAILNQKKLTSRQQRNVLSGSGDDR